MKVKRKVLKVQRGGLPDFRVQGEKADFRNN
jgi:hypothetical protein